MVSLCQTREFNHLTNTHKPYISLSATSEAMSLRSAITSTKLEASRGISTIYKLYRHREIATHVIAVAMLAAGSGAVFLFAMLFV